MELTNYGTAQFKVDIYTQTTYELHASAWYNIIIQSSIHTSDALMKCITGELHIVHYV